MVNIARDVRYIRAYFSIIPKRIELLRELKAEKENIDRKIRENIEVSPNEIEILIEIIGRDTFFHKAEDRKKPSIRHTTWKILKSVKNFQSHRIDPLLNIGGGLLQVINFNGFIYPSLLRVVVSLEKSDELYQKEVEALQGILEDEESIGTYKSLLREEDKISDSIRPLAHKLYGYLEEVTPIIQEASKKESNIIVVLFASLSITFLVFGVYLLLKDMIIAKAAIRIAQALILGVLSSITFKITKVYFESSSFRTLLDMIKKDRGET